MKGTKNDALTINAKLSAIESKINEIADNLYFQQRDINANIIANILKGERQTECYIIRCLSK